MDKTDDAEIEARWHSGDPLTPEEDRRLTQIQDAALARNARTPAQRRADARYEPKRDTVQVKARLTPAQLSALDAALTPGESRPAGLVRLAGL